MPRVGTIVLWATFCVALVSGCGSDDNEELGSSECCKVRAICQFCDCSDAQESVGYQDKKRSCDLVLYDWEDVGCLNCQNADCMRGC